MLERSDHDHRLRRARVEVLLQVILRLATCLSNFFEDDRITNERVYFDTAAS
jgi:hypothetical protein